MNRKNLLKIALIFFICAAVILVFTYFFFHFVTDTGITTEFQPEAQKPFVASLLGQLAVLFLFGSLTSLTFALVVYPKEKE